ncbi:MAG: pyridoxal-phosphate dependent enzyme [Candidatus Aminicenantia bacterium]
MSRILTGIVGNYIILGVENVVITNTERHEMYFENILQTIGHTPLVKLNRVTQEIKPTILAKLEFFNPGGSVKDRMALHIIKDAENKGLLKPGGTIIECTSGNTGVGVAIYAAVKGYKVIFTIPDKMSEEKINLMKAFGAEVIVCPTEVPPDSPESYYEVARRITQEIPNSFYVNQYHNPKNIEAHYVTTGPEIWEQTEGKIDYRVVRIEGIVRGIEAESKTIQAALKDLGAKVTGTEIQIDLPGDVLFDFDKWDIRPDAEETLRKVGEIIKEYKSPEVIISGHTDSIGSEEYNQELSEKRAESVKSWLTQNAGINPEIMKAIGYGESRPIAPNTNPDGSDNPEGRQENRRVEILIKKK